MLTGKASLQILLGTVEIWRQVSEGPCLQELGEKGICKQLAVVFIGKSTLGLGMQDEGWKVAQGLRGCTAFAEDPSEVPSI